MERELTKNDTLPAWGGGGGGLLHIFSARKPYYTESVGSIRQQISRCCTADNSMEPGPTAGPRRPAGGRRERNVSTTPRLRKSVRRTHAAPFGGRR